jgi:HEAT repeat protein
VPAAVDAEDAASDVDKQVNYFCARLDEAKTEGLLGIHSDATMSYAIKASESEDPDERELAAYLFSYIGTAEATKDLKRLAADTNPEVAEAAKERLSAEQPDDLDNYAITYESGNEPAHRAATLLALNRTLTVLCSCD